MISNNLFNYGIKDVIQNTILNNKNIINILEIGAFEGSSTTWFIDNYLHHDLSTITVIEPFTDSELLVPSKNYELFINNIKKVLYPEKVIFYKDRSITVLPTLLKDKKHYDIILINGSNFLQDIYEDIILCWELLKQNGYLFIDSNLMYLVKDIFDKIKNVRYEIIFDNLKTIVKKI